MTKYYLFALLALLLLLSTGCADKAEAEGHLADYVEKHYKGWKVESSECLKADSDGDVNICCMDWGHDYVCGNVNTTRLSSIWGGPEFEAARAVLGSKSREFSPCNRCNAGPGARSGLLPKYPPPTEEDKKVVRRVVAANTSRNKRGLVASTSL